MAVVLLGRVGTPCFWPSVAVTTADNYRLFIKPSLKELAIAAFTSYYVKT